MHLIIDTEDYVNAAPAEGEGDHSEGEGSHPQSDEGEGSHPRPDEGEVGHAHPSPISSGGQGRAASATALELLQEELLSRLFPGVAPQPPSSQSAGASSSAIVFQQQESVIALMHEGRVNDSAEISSEYLTPPSVIGVCPAAVCCQPPALPPLASSPEAAACSPISGAIWITAWLQLSAPLPSEGVTLLARHQGGFLDTRLQRADDNDGALIIKVRVLQ